MKNVTNQSTVKNPKFDDNCIFCKIVKGELPSTIVFEDSTVLAFRDISGDFPDHVLVVPKMHTKSFLSAPSDILSKVATVAQKIGNDFVSSEKYDGTNFIANCGSAAGQSIDHFHIHVIPRKRGDRSPLSF